MRRHLLTLALAGLFGSLFVANDASACCHKRRTVACQTCVAAPVCVVAPAPPPAPVCEPVVCAPAPKKCGLFGGHKLFGCFHKQRCAAPAPAPTICEVPLSCPAPIPTCAPCYSAPVASYQAMPSGQGY